MCKLLRIVALSVMAALLPMAAEAAVSLSPDQLVRATADKVLSQVQTNKKSLEVDTSKIYELVNQYILPHFNFLKMSRSVLGKHWLKASPEQQTNFAEAFQVLLVRTYAVALLNYSDQAIEYLPFRMQPDARQAVVKTRISDGASPPLPVDYLLQSEEDGAWKVVDVKIDGISLVSNYRTSFSEHVRRDGIDALIKQLKTRGSELADESGLTEVDQPPAEEQNAAPEGSTAPFESQQTALEPLAEQPEPPKPAEPAEPQPEPLTRHPPALTEMESPSLNQPIPQGQADSVAEHPMVIDPLDLDHEAPPAKPDVPAKTAVKEAKPGTGAPKPAETKHPTPPVKQEKPATEAAKPSLFGWQIKKPATTDKTATIQDAKTKDQKPAEQAKAKTSETKTDTKAAADKAAQTTAKPGKPADGTAKTETPAEAAPEQPKKVKVPSLVF